VDFHEGTLRGKVNNVYFQFSSVQLRNLCFTQSYNKNCDGCADA